MSMEFETRSADASPEVSDTQRLAASARKIELTPLHADVAPDALAEDVPASVLNGGILPVASVASDTEDTSDYDTNAIVMPPKTPLLVKFLYVLGALLLIAVTVAAVGYLTTMSSHGTTL